MSDIENRYSDDSSLWDLFLTGDERAYSHIYDLYVHSLFCYGLRFTSDRELVKDCVQDVFVKMHLNRKKLSPTDNIRLYLFISLKNHLLNRFKQEQNNAYFMDELSVLPVEPFEEETMEDLLIMREEEQQQKETMAGLLAVLTPRQREVVGYRYIDCLPMDEICKLMDMKAQSVQNLLQRSIIKMKKKFEK
ncbi:RNA polymerase sigma factor [Parabacteroides sp. Marseille-P3160]|uniref:RNA polymerase sigma factor n=1 Tax=Parabacteroides sp. Marseille-P3160 TaxID=1917887 RepID=UPI0009B95B54|nr:sigma-70 family RNA polymerase sigma factor [Parabacteroides sp. Marseille-P3160]